VEQSHLLVATLFTHLLLAGLWLVEFLLNILLLLVVVVQTILVLAVVVLVVILQTQIYFVP